LNLSRLSAAAFDRLDATRGMLIAFEGPDGSGKTTQRKLFKMWLEGAGHRVVTSKWNSSELIRPLVKARKKLHALGPLEFSLLHASDFRHRLETEILPALAAGKTVIADRYLFTALARDCARHMDLCWLLKLYGPILWPDVVFYFSVSPETSLRRVAAEGPPSYYEAGQDETGETDPHTSYARFVRQVIQEYSALAVIFQFVTIDAEKTIHEQHNEIRRMFRDAGRRSWRELNGEAVADWLAARPEVHLA
jgi:dTMP kinase